MEAEELQELYKSETGIMFLDLKYTRWLESKLLTKPTPTATNRTAEEVKTPSQILKEFYETADTSCFGEKSEIRGMSHKSIVAAMHRYHDQFQPNKGQEVDWGKVKEELERDIKDGLYLTAPSLIDWFRTRLSSVEKVEWPSDEEISSAAITNNYNGSIRDAFTDGVDWLKSRLTESNK